MAVFLLFLAIIGLMILGVPIAVALGLASIGFLLIMSDASLASIAQSFFQAMAGHYTLLAIPFFILASSFMSTGGVARRIIRFSIAVVGHFRGGLAIAGVFACMIFAALSGSSPATVVAIGSIVIAGMTQVGYSKDFAAGVIANAGTLGILIPPSIVMVVYASATDVSVGRLFLAGVIPGLLAGGMLMVTIYVLAVIRDLPKGAWLGWQEVAASFVDAFWGLLLIVIILGGIYSGQFTPTEAAVVAAVYAFFAANFIYRDLGPLQKRRWLGEANTRSGFGFSALLILAIAALEAWIIAVILNLPEPISFYTVVISIAIVAGFIVAFGRGGISPARIARYFIALLGIAPGLVVACVVTNGSFAAMNAAWSVSWGILGSAGAGVLYTLFFVVLTVVVLLPAVIMAFILTKSAQELRESGASLGASFSGGAAALGRGVVETGVYLIPAIFHRDLKKTMLESGKLTVTLMFIIANALILKHVLTEEQIPQQVASAMLSAGFGPILFLVIVNVILLIGGQFMEPSGLIVIVAPLVFPIAIELGIDPIHLGIIMVVNMEIGMITPPVGLNLFVTSGVAGMPMMAVVWAALPFLMVLLVFLVLVTYVPAISTFLPTYFMGPEVIVK